MATFNFRGVDLPEPTNVDDFTDSDLATDDSGRDNNGAMHKKVINVFDQWPLKWDVLSNKEHGQLMLLTRGVSKGLLIHPNQYGDGVKRGFYYVGDRKSSIRIIDHDTGEILWKNTSLTFIKNN